jgi:toxin ParE1/3/4
MSDEDAPTRNISIRPRAVTDIESHAVYLEERTTPEIAARFRDAIMTAIDQIATMPGMGTPREMKNPRLTGVRFHIVPEFRSYLLFYLTSTNEIEVIRVFHGAQDIQSILEDEK